MFLSALNFKTFLTFSYLVCVIDDKNNFFPIFVGDLGPNVGVLFNITWKRKKEFVGICFILREHIIITLLNLKVKIQNHSSTGTKKIKSK